MSFPTTGLIDAFAYGVGGLNGVGNWTGPVGGFGNNLRIGDIVTQTINSGAGVAGADYLTTTYGPDVEAYADIVNVDTTTNIARLMVRMQNPSSVGTRSNYDVQIVGSTWTIGRTVNNSRTVLGTFTQAVAAGDKFGISVIGSTITAWWRDHTSGLWSVIGTDTDSTITGAGNIGVEIQGGTWVLDNLSGGSAAQSFGAGKIPSGATLRGGTPANVATNLIASGKIFSRAYGSGTYGEGTYGGSSIVHGAASIVTATPSQSLASGKIPSAAIVRGALINRIGTIVLDAGKILSSATVRGSSILISLQPDEAMDVLVLTPDIPNQL